ncbi:hypothetical protein ABK040_008850 [Willaertia magna]
MHQQVLSRTLIILLLLGLLYFAKVESKKLVKKSNNLPVYKELFFTQKLDHFDYGNQATFQQRYLVNDQYATSNGPVFIYTGHEDDIEFWWEQSSGIVTDYAPRFGALVIFIEHRYYGKSLPFGKSSYDSYEHLKYLVAPQQSMDVVTFIKEKFGFDYKRNRPVILLAASLGGVYGSWIRQHHPSLVDGVIASSAQNFGYVNETDPNGFYDITQEGLRTCSRLDIYPQETCDRVIQRGLLKVNEYINNGKYLEIGRRLNLCSPTTTKAQASMVLKSYQNIIPFIVRFNYPYPVNWFSSMKAYPTNELCRSVALTMKNSKASEDDTLFQAINNVFNVFFNSSTPQTCFDLNGFLNNLGERFVPWYYQGCADFIAPIGAQDNNRLFPYSPFVLSTVLDRCQKDYGYIPDPLIDINYFGGKRSIPAMSNIYFTQAEFDPWRAHGIPNEKEVPEELLKMNPRIKYSYMKGAAHQHELRTSSVYDPQSVKDTREDQMKTIKQWIQEFYTIRDLLNRN